MNIIKPFAESVEIKADAKTMKTFLATHHEIIFNSESNEVLVITKEKHPAGTNFCEKPNKITSIKEVLLKCDCLVGSVVNGKYEGILFPFSLSAPKEFEYFIEPTSILFRLANKERTSDKSIYLEGDAGTIVAYNCENSRLKCF